MREDLLEKLLRYAIKKKELETLLTSLGFIEKAGKGSHCKWIKAGLPPIVIATHDKDLKDYQVKKVIEVLTLERGAQHEQKGKKGEKSGS